MLIKRSNVVTAAVAAAAALAATGITYASASGSVAQAPYGGTGTNPTGNPTSGTQGKGNEGKIILQSQGNQNINNNNNHREHHEEEGRIQINERTYSARVGGCITVVSGLGATSLNVRNDSRKTVEVFRGAVCDNGAPIATVGPYSSSDGLDPGTVPGFSVQNGVVGSFRVVDRHHDREDRD
ncbi:hypothetical protein [Streptomyces sp. NPDC046805]|uniref:hypothetical protein n=1 Tax=Streptomyces sp. NPDC046805 TaxID=3155134 RepID=UPI00340C39D7